jgi:hypothetical protein
MLNPPFSTASLKFPEFFAGDRCCLIGKAPGPRMGCLPAELEPYREAAGSIELGCLLDLGAAALNQNAEHDDEQNACNNADDGGGIHVKSPFANTAVSVDAPSASRGPCEHPMAKRQVVASCKLRGWLAERIELARPRQKIRTDFG